MPIKYADSVKLEQDGRKSYPGKNYAGASWAGENGFHGSRELTGRASLRRAGQTKGKDNPLLGACQSRSRRTGRVLNRPFSTRSSNPDVRAFAKYLERQQNKNGEAQA